ncbi:MAG: efflux RND transporter periplasmic adaptor subunit [Saprospiraceae bacterium]
MKAISLNIIVFFFLLLTLFSCKFSIAEKTAATKKNNKILTKSTTKIRNHPTQKKALNISTTTTGTLIPQQQTTLHLKSTGTIQQLPIQEGQYIQKGSLIAELDDQALQLALGQRELEMEDAIGNKKDLLIANGGEAEIDTSVSAERLDLILTLSGVRRALQGIKQAQFQIDQAKIYAPFSGVIADIKVRQYEQGNAGQEICRLLNPNTFEAEFQLTEAEALRVKIGQAVKVIPLAIPEKSFKAAISIINPIVNEQGLVTVRARLKNTKHHRLLEGMHVRVQVERSIPNQLVIPKTALVLRSGKSVVFTYEKETGLAKWNYVTVAHENETEIAISEGLKAGDLVIYEGNMNLSHDAEVAIDSTMIIGH